MLMKPAEMNLLQWNLILSSNLMIRLLKKWYVLTAFYQEVCIWDVLDQSIISNLQFDNQSYPFYAKERCFR